MAEKDEPRGGTDGKPPRMPAGDDPRSGDEIKSLLGSGGPPPKGSGGPPKKG